MNKQLENKVKAIQEILLPYFQDPKENCAYSNPICLYLDSKTGNKCAIGKMLKKGAWQETKMGCKDLFEKYDKSKIMLKKYFRLGFYQHELGQMQNIHDSLISSDYCYTITYVENLCRYLQQQEDEQISTEKMFPEIYKIALQNKNK